MKLILTVLLISIGTSAHCQESETYLKFKQNFRYREGYILNMDSVKVEGLIKDNLAEDDKKYSVVNFVDKSGKKRKYKPDNIKGYGYSIHNFVSDKFAFYEIVVIGRKASLYKIISKTTWSNPTGVGMSSMTYSNENESFFVKKINEPSMKLVRKKNFKEEFSKYFGDCEEVVEKIRKEEFTYTQIRQIITKYNYCDK